MKKAFLITYIIWPFYLSKALAIQTQVNEVTDLFDKHIENKDSLLLDMKKQTDDAYGLIQSGQHHDSIEGIDKAEGKTNELNSIKETDLGTSGRQKRLSKEYQFYDENELEPDYTKSGNLMHKSDAEDIISATEKTMSKLGTDLMKKLIELGFNCKTVKGAIHKEPTYYIEIKKEEQKNAEYDQFFCEEPKDQYSCNDTVSLQCKKRGIRWKEWQDKQIRVSGTELLSSGKIVFWVEKTRRRCFEYKVSVGPRRSRKIFFGLHTINPDPYHVEQMREFLVTKHQGATIENISTEMSSWWEGSLESIAGLYYQGRIGNKSYAWSSYVINYKYRDGDEICEQWDETWSERCVLK